MYVTHNVLPGEATAARRFTVGRFLRFDRVLLGDFQPLMRLHTAITDKFRTLDAPGRGNGVVRAATTLDHVLGGFHTAGIFVRRVFTEEHVVDDELHSGFHLAHRTKQDRRVVREVGEFLLQAWIACHV